jgi:hypothetical protein
VRQIALVEYNDLELHPILDPDFTWLLTIKELALALNSSVDVLVKLQLDHEDRLIEGKHYIIDHVNTGSYRSAEIMMWSKAGVMRLLYLMQTDEALALIDFLEDLDLQFEGNVDSKAQKFYGQIEQVLENKMQTLKSDDLDFETLNAMMHSVDQFAKRYQKEDQNSKEEGGIMGMISAIFDGNTQLFGEQFSQILQEAVQERSQKAHEEAPRIKPANFELDNDGKDFSL